MEKKIIDRLIGSADDKIFELEVELNQGVNAEYTKTSENYFKIYNKMKEYKNITPILLDLEYYNIYKA